MSDTTPTPPPPEPPHVPAGWYPDPWSPGQTRYWDGAQWTSHQSGQYQQGQAQQPPLPPPSQPPYGQPAQPPSPYVAPTSYGAGGQQGYGQYAQPQGGPPVNVDFGGAIRLLFQRVGDYQGRSTRSEFWFALLFGVIVSAALGLVTSIAFPGTLDPSTGVRATSDLATGLQSLLSLASFVFFLPLTIRRLHDTGKPWPYILMGLIPCAGFIIMIVYMATSSQPGANQWGRSASPQHY